VTELAARRQDPAHDAAQARAAITRRRRFENLLDRHESRLRRVAYGMLGDPHRVDDVLQDAFIKAYRKLPAAFASEQAEAAWIYRLVHRTCLDELRARRRRREVAGVIELHAAVERGAPERDEASLVVAGALATLDPGARAVILLVDLIGLDYETAGAALGVPRGTVASRLHAARTALRKALDA
jgi:RNA polymerase sigma-70 factor (ECF subfamily)